MGTPTLVVVSGPAGAGKTTLAHALARSVGCPAVCRDEIKEGMVRSAGAGFEPAPGDPLTMRTLDTFFDVLELLVRAEVTVVAEAAFQHQVWQPRLERLGELADLRLVRCAVDPAVGVERRLRRLAEDPSRHAHADQASLADPANAERYYTEFRHVELPVPTLDVDATDGYLPDLATVTAFATG